MTLIVDPLTIWLTSMARLRIQRGDRLADVAAVVSQYWNLDGDEARAVVGYWYAIGERRARRLAGLGGYHGWRDHEVRATPGRRYLATPRSVAR